MEFQLERDFPTHDPARPSFLARERSSTVRPGRPSRTEKWVELITPVWTIGWTGSVEVEVELRSFTNHHQ